MNSSEPETAGSKIDMQFIDHIRRADGLVRRELLLHFLREQLAASLALEPSQVGLKDSLLELGIDSVKAVEFKFLLESKLDQQISSSLLFDYPTLESLAGFLLELICQPQKEPDSPAEQTQTAAGFSQDELARLLAREIRELNLSPAD